MFNYRFYKVYECDYVLQIEEINARDLHQAMAIFLTKHSIKDYDLMAINGEYV